MSRFYFSLSLVLVFNSSAHLVMSKRKSQIAPGHHHSSQIVNFSAGTSHVNVPNQQNSSSSYSLSQLQPPFQTPSSSTSAKNNEHSQNIHRTPFPTKGSHQTSGTTVSGDDGHGGMRNFNDRFAPTHADFLSLPQPTTKFSKSRYRRGFLSFWSFLVSDTSRETTERRTIRKRRSLSTTKPKNSGILQASNSNLSFVQDQQNLLLKLDRNYTPKDIAEYILSTGDERGIIQVVADMVQDGQLMASRDDLILFLETVQRELNKLKALNQLYRPSPSV